MSDAGRIVLLYREGSIPPVVLDAIRSRTPGGLELVALDSSASREVRRSHVATARYLIVYAAAFDDLDVAREARLLQLLSAGYDRIDVAALKAAGIPVADNGGANAPTVAEHAVLLMLAVLRKLPAHHAALERGEWLGLREATSMRELRGRQVGIVGFGRIGREVARIVRGFLAEPVYFDAAPVPASVAAELGARPMALETLLESSDVVSVHTPLTDATRGLIGARALARMKRGAILVNTARGPVVDEAALVRALDARAIAGAGLDVFEREPIGPDHPLLGRDNVVLTPHTAGTTLDTWTRRLDFAFTNIERMERNEAPLSVVNP